MPAKNTATTVKLLRRRFVEDEVPALAYPKVPSRVVPFLNLRYREVMKRAKKARSSASLPFTM
jgi:hypothetical protein